MAWLRCESGKQADRQVQDRRLYLLMMAEEEEADPKPATPTHTHTVGQGAGERIRAGQGGGVKMGRKRQQRSVQREDTQKERKKH